ncbi:hypothetical protein EVA_16002 [gut metagenome]|uniref:Uncharacterized protein n=1 Tax=gut metagenome TaxID=749906 RepID=J9FLU4_9ZZZZ
MMSNEYNGHAMLTAKLCNTLYYLSSALRVKHCGRLVQNDNFRLHSNNACYCHSLLLSAGEKMRCVKSVFIHTHHL